MKRRVECAVLVTIDQPPKFASKCDVLKGLFGPPQIHPGRWGFSLSHFRVSAQSSAPRTEAALSQATCV